LPDLAGVSLVLGKYRSLSVSTPWAYQQYRQQFQQAYAQTLEAQEKRRQTGESVALLHAMSEQNLPHICACLHNDLEKVVLPAYPQVAALRETFATQPVLGTMMSGSGPTVFALVDSAPRAEEVYTAVRSAIPDPDLELWVAQFCSTGIRFVP
jgi:4-diphosphocytidyl-2-C-methyl-D-erythritol kinase